jgi:hypothetical protein
MYGFFFFFFFFSIWEKKNSNLTLNIFGKKEKIIQALLMLETFEFSKKIPHETLGSPHFPLTGEFISP